MRVRRQLRNRKRVRLLAASFAQRVTAADVNRGAPAQIRQREVDSPVAAKGRAQQTEKSAWFWLIGSNCPLHSAHPFGANTKLMILISDRNGSAIFISS